MYDDDEPMRPIRDYKGIYFALMEAVIDEKLGRLDDCPICGTTLQDGRCPNPAKH